MSILSSVHSSLPVEPQDQGYTVIREVLWRSPDRAGLMNIKLTYMNSTHVHFPRVGGRNMYRLGAVKANTHPYFHHANDYVRVEALMD